MLNQDMCVFFLIGHCSNKDRCKDSHKVRNCPYKGCNPQMCHLRHPPVCKMWAYNACQYAATCNHLHYFPQFAKKQVVAKETIMFNVLNLVNAEETEEKEEIETELKMKLGTANTNIKDLNKIISKLEGERKCLEEKAKQQDNTLKSKEDKINCLKEDIKYKEDKFKKKEEEVTTLKGLLNSKQETAQELKEKLEIVKSTNLKLEKDFQAKKENVQEKEEKINCLEGENHKKSLRVDELETEVKSTLMELNRKKEIVLELEKLTFTQQETIEKVKEEGDAEFMKLQRDLIALITNYAPNFLKKLDFLEEIRFL